MKSMLSIVRCTLLSAALATTLSAFAQMSITPEPGEVNQLSEFYLNFDGNWALANRSAKIAMTGPDGVEIPRIMSGSTGTNYYINFEDDAVITTPGEYILTIPATKFEVDGVAIEETSYKYTIIASEELPVKIDPAPGTVKKLVNFKLTFDGEWALANRSAKITMTGPDGVTLPKIMSGSMGGYYEIYFEDDAEVTEPGNYYLTIPEGKFAVNDTELPAITFEYTIVDNGNTNAHEYEITPEPGTYDAITDGFKLTFNTDQEISVNTHGVYLEGPAGDMKLFVESPANMPYVTVLPVDTNDEPITLTEKGEYKLIFSYRSVTVGGVANEEPYVFVYQISGEDEQKWIGDCVADPADDSTVESLKEINVTFADANMVSIAMNPSQDILPTLYNAETLDVVCKGIAFANGNVLELSLNKEVKDAGYYVLSIPADFVSVDGLHPAYDIMFTYTIESAGAELEYTYSLNPADGSLIEANSAIEITFEAENLKEVTNNIYAWGKGAPYFTNAMGAGNPNLQVTAEGNTYIFTHEYDFETEGTYTLVIPAGYFTLLSTDGNEVKNAEITADYQVVLASLDSLVTENNTVDIYNVSGVCVLSNATLSDAKSLPAGIYVINGQKVAIKK